jgi:hypothetical protein
MKSILLLILSIVLVAFCERAHAQSAVLPNLRIHPSNKSQVEIHMDAMRKGGQDSIWIFAVGILSEDDSDWIGYYLSKDGGKTWTIGDTIQNARLAPFTNDPSCGIGPDSTLYVAYMGNNGTTGNRPIFQKSTDAGATWSVPTVLIDESTDHPFLSVDHQSGNIYIIAREIDTNAFVYKRNGSPFIHHDTVFQLRAIVLRSTDGGSSFAKVAALGTDFEEVPEISVAFDGTVYAYWMQLDVNNHQQRMMDYSTNGGTTWHSDTIPFLYSTDPTTIYLSVPSITPRTGFVFERAPDYFPRGQTAHMSGATIGGVRKLYVASTHWTGEPHDGQPRCTSCA